MSDSWQSIYLPISWTQYSKLAFGLSEKIKAKQKKIDLIVAIARGGLTLSHILSDYLKLHVAAFTIQSYKDLQQESIPTITFGLGGTLENKQVLLVDDVADTGKTFIRGIEYLEELGAQKEHISTASLHHKPHSKYKPDFFMGETDKWIIYPTEVRETIMSLTKLWQKKGIAKEIIFKRLRTLGFKEVSINQFSL